MVVMAKTVTLSARVPEELRRKLAELGIAPSEVIKKALVRAVSERSRELLLDKASAAGFIAKKVGKEGWARAIRDGRDSR